MATCLVLDLGEALELDLGTAGIWLFTLDLVSDKQIQSVSNCMWW